MIVIQTVICSNGQRYYNRIDRFTKSSGKKSSKKGTLRINTVTINSSDPHSKNTNNIDIDT